MPDTFLGLVLFVLFLAPGLSYFIVRETRRPQREISAFRETAALVLVGVACNLVVAIGFTLLRWVLPGHTPDVGSFVRNPAQYFKANFSYAVYWSLALVGLACVVAIWFGTRQGLLLPGLHLRRPYLTWRQVPLGMIRFESTWYHFFHYDQKSFIYCGCHLEDGSWVGGFLKWYSTEVEETGDRELALTYPRYRAPGSKKIADLTGMVIVSARRLTMLEVSYLTDAGAKGLLQGREKVSTRAE
jgi:hypothetical protein